MNWHARPLTSHDVIAQSIAATTTGTGLKVRAELDTGQYPTGVKVDDKEIAALPITRHRFHGDWNYTLQPTNSQALGRQDARKPEPDPPACTGLLSHPLLTGMSQQELVAMTEQLICSALLSRGQVKTASGFVEAVFCLSGTGCFQVVSVSWSTRGQTDMRGLDTAGRAVRLGRGRCLGSSVATSGCS